MDSDTFLHYLLTPAEKHPDIIWGPRLPYKLGESLAESHTPLAQAWGIQISESINHALVASIMFIIVLLSGLIAGFYAWATRDNQSAIAIGTWLTTVQAMGLTAVYLRQG
jgi:hypothetical protein